MKDSSTCVFVSVSFKMIFQLFTIVCYYADEYGRQAVQPVPRVSGEESDATTAASYSHTHPAGGVYTVLMFRGSNWDPLPKLNIKKLNYVVSTQESGVFQTQSREV